MQTTKVEETPERLLQMYPLMRMNLVELASKLQATVDNALENPDEVTSNAAVQIQQLVKWLSNEDPILAVHFLVNALLSVITILEDSILETVHTREERMRGTKKPASD